MLVKIKMIDYNIILALNELIWLLQKNVKINISPFWVKHTFTTSSMWMTLYHTRKSPSVCINLETAHVGETVLELKKYHFFTLILIVEAQFYSRSKVMGR